MTKKKIMKRINISLKMMNSENDESDVGTGEPQPKRSRIDIESQFNLLETEVVSHIDRIRRFLAQDFSDHQVPDVPLFKFSEISRDREDKENNVPSISSQDKFIAAASDPSIPDERYSNFQFVQNLVEEIWFEKEECCQPKLATIGEILSKSNGYNNKENTSSLIQVLEKLSSKNRLIMTVQDNNLIVCPFETLNVTDLQMESIKELDNPDISSDDSLNLDTSSDSLEDISDGYYSEYEDIDDSMHDSEIEDVSEDDYSFENVFENPFE